MIQNVAVGSGSGDEEVASDLVNGWGRSESIIVEWMQNRIYGTKYGMDNGEIVMDSRMQGSQFVV